MRLFVLISEYSWLKKQRQSPRREIDTNNAHPSIIIVLKLWSANISLISY